MVGRTAGGVALLERQLMNSRTPEIAILFTHIYVVQSFQRSSVNRLCTHSVLVLSKQTRIAGTRFIWKAVIVNSSETSGSFSNGRALKMYS